MGAILRTTMPGMCPSPFGDLLPMSVVPVSNVRDRNSRSPITSPCRGYEFGDPVMQVSLQPDVSDGGSSELEHVVLLQR